MREIEATCSHGTSLYHIALVLSVHALPNAQLYSASCDVAIQLHIELIDVTTVCILKVSISLMGRPVWA